MKRKNYEKRISNSQLTNFQTYNMYLRQLLVLAENVFQFKNLPDYIDVSYMNKILLRQGAIAFFYEDVLDEIVCLPFTQTNGILDMYGRPKKIRVQGANNYNRWLDIGDFVIMYDNNGRYPLYMDLYQYAERLGQVTRTIDINISHQKTPRFWKTSQDKLKSVQDTIKKVDSFEEIIVTYDDINLDDTDLVLSPAPYVADKLEDTKDKIWAEVMRLIGISSIASQKKERMITDEISMMQGGTIASRFSRFQPRKQAIDLINEKFEKYLENPIEVEYYDGEPSTIGNDGHTNLYIEEDEESDGDKNVSMGI